MLTIKTVLVGKMNDDVLKRAADEYYERLSAYANLSVEQPKAERVRANLSDQEKRNIKRSEGARILDRLSDGEYVYALDREGRQLSSPQFARRINRHQIRGQSSLSFVIGGTLGLSRQVLKEADARLSLSKFTFPRQMIPLILFEQLYRAFKIIRNEPYHH